MVCPQPTKYKGRPVFSSVGGQSRVELGADGVVVVGDESVVVGGIFAGDDDGGGVDAVFQGIEAGRGLALGGAGSGGLLRVGAIRVDLSRGCHDYDFACQLREFWVGLS